MVRINGQELDLNGQNLLTYLQEKEYRIDRIAVELNKKIVPRKTYGQVTLHDGDSLEIVHFVGGG